MKLTKIFFVIYLISFLSTNIMVNAEGDDCMCMDMCPAEYELYLVVDELANAMMSNVPVNKKDEVKDWMQTPWGKQTFTTVGGRNSNASSDLKNLSDLVYSKLTEYYGIPEALQNHFIITKGLRGKITFYVDTFGPNINIPSSVMERINSDAKNIFEWMLSCRTEQKFLPLEDYLK